MSSHESSRRIEGSLLFLVLLLLASGFTLVFLARTRDGVPDQALNLNTASADELAISLGIDPALAALLVQHRQRLGSFTESHQPAALSVFPNPEVTAKVRFDLDKSHLDVNSSGVNELEKVLGLSHPVARRIIAYRDTLPDGKFRHPGDLTRVSVIDDRSLSALGNRLIVRHPAEVFQQFAIVGGSIFLMLIGVPFFLRKNGVGGDPYLLPIALLLAGFGMIALFSIKDPLRDTPVFLHQVRGLWLGMLALIVGASLPARGGDRRNSFAGVLPARANLRRYTYVWVLAALVLMISLWLFGTGPEVVRLSLGFFQPIEVIKILLVFFLAGYLTDRSDLLTDALHRWRPPLPKGWAARYRGFSVPRRHDIGPILIMYIAALLLFLVVRDLGPALVLFGAFLGTLYLATGRSGIVWLGLLLILAGGEFAYRMHVGVLPVRVEMWRQPWNNPHSNGMQLGQSLWAMSSGGLWGSGLGLGAPGMLPRGGSDLIFASLAEEMGLLGSLTILVLFVLLVWRGLRIALHASTDFDRLLAGGLTALLACQIFVIVAGVTGLIPLTGLSLPFISYGNSSLVADFFLLGLLRGISAPTGSVPVGAQPLFRRTVSRFAVVTAVALLGAVGIGRCLWVQGIDADQIAGQLIRTPDADRVVRGKVNPRLIAIEQSIPRGSIYDRNGHVLATSRLTEISTAMPDAPERARSIFLRGRYYPHGPAFAHLIGYVNPAVGGPTGLEKQFEHQLRGFESYSDLLSDYRSKDLPTLSRRPRAGNDLILTLDADLQEAAFGILQRATHALTDKRNGRHKERGALVVIDPISGETLVSVSTPSFDPNDLSPSKWQSLRSNVEGATPLLDRARIGLYPPGSTLKVATAAAGLEEGIDPPYDCNHIANGMRWTYRGQTYSRRIQDDQGDPPHNVIRMARALEVSCNLYFANLGIALGPERLYRAFADRFELHSLKSLDVFATGLAENAFGQGTMLVTPTEMARIAAAIANQGRMMQPLYWRELRSADGIALQHNTPILMGRPMGELNAKKLGEMMRAVVTGGTARNVFDDVPVEVAGKTGTAQNEQGDSEPHSWFIGFTPFSRPQYAFACILENGGYGKRGAAPAVHDLLRVLFLH